ncbi:ABC transporter substrate-binding protein [Actinomadura sp. NEAU-AAG7]|uniref:ABC transporter substrate-binding protein n=1 Tax=Actinomadura sp. NEAU-AAG7 TaxID=2839640 RepID=UPI001BE4BBD2|nr:NrtA/SsuA/CpmA family ABC transporter substrate-binding protein [Actinomadura sp. NEAU-AAG7]MBT2207264.1 NrtA/SsuA/CpmA family ABC transporter substrate-binding protein [Actinomadura sp. NEAU-AAG7]
MTVRIGVNGHDPVLYFLSTLGLLEPELDVEWVPYSPGPRAPWLLGGDLDFVGCGQTPMLRAHADDLPLVYVASSANRPLQGALVVRADGPVHTPADLKGRRVAFPPPAWPAQLVAGALDQAGLTIRDVETVESAGDADLERLLAGEIDAATILGPRLIEAEETGRVRHLVPTDSAVSNRHLFAATRRFAEESRDTLRTVLTAMERANRWVVADHARAAERRAAERRYDAASWGGSARTWEAMLRRMPWGLAPIDSAFIDEQDRHGALLVAGGLLDRAGSARAAFVPDLIWTVREAVHQAHHS